MKKLNRRDTGAEGKVFKAGFLRLPLLRVSAPLRIPIP